MINPKGKIVKYPMLLVIAILLFVGCSEDQTNVNTPEPEPEEYSLSVFLDGPTDDILSWAILHSNDGQQILDSRSLQGEGTFDFGLVDSSTVTVSIIERQTDEEPVRYFISTFWNAPAGNWTIRRFYSSDTLGTAHVFTYLPRGNYTEAFSGGLGSSVVVSDYESGSYDNVNHLFTVRYLDSLNKMSVYGAGYNEATGVGYYGLKKGLDFTIGTTNGYSVTADIPLASKPMMTSRPVEAISIRFSERGSVGSWSLRSSFKEVEGGKSDYLVFYPDSLDVESFFFVTSVRDTESRSNYFIATEEVPDMLNVPGGAVSAQVNSSNSSIESIIYTGEADMLNGTWSGSNNTSTLFWRVYASGNNNVLERPLIPDSVFQNLAIIDTFPAMNPFEVAAEEWPEMNGYEEGLTYWLIGNGIPPAHRYQAYRIIGTRTSALVKKDRTMSQGEVVQRILNIEKEKIYRK